MTRTLAPFTPHLPRQWGGIEQELENAMRNMFDWDFEGNSENVMSFSPTLNVVETEVGYEVSVDLPGVKPEDLTVEFRDDALWIAGERKIGAEQEKSTYHRLERHYGLFRRVVRLSKDVDPESIVANYKDGVLMIRANKSASARPRRIEVTV